MTQEELEQKYFKIPQEMKQTRRWCGYKVEEREGKQTKVPYNAINGLWAKCNDSDTWTTFKIAILGCVKYGFDGIGFMLGEDTNTNTCYFGIDLDNHLDSKGNKPMSEDEFYDFSSEFINGLNSYTEYSHSGEGIHIICKGKLPVGARRKNGVAVEMYDKFRFFTMTGNTINNVPISDRTEEIKPLWEKYFNTAPTVVETPKDGKIHFGENMVSSTIEINHSNLSDNELMSKIRSSKYGVEFTSLYNGDLSNYNDDHSAADMAFCKILAFWSGCDKAQMDRIFRSSGLYREKWDAMRGQDTYGNITLDKAIATQNEVYKPAKERLVIVSNNDVIEPTTEIVEFDERKDPIVKNKQIFKNYPLTDTGNAERFYDQYGEYFKFNKDNKTFMFWNGKTWTRDSLDNVRKYANKLLDVLKADAMNTQREIHELNKEDEEKLAELQMYLKAQLRNLDRVSNKAGKDAMLSEFESLHDIPTMNKEFDTQEHLLNTESGIVDLLTGEIKPFDRKAMLSKNTNCKVSYEEPKVWNKFLHDIFARDNEQETEEIIDTIQMALGESLTGRTNKEHLFILYGHGSNGKSTFIKVVNDAFGDYGTSMNSEMLIQNPNASSQSNEFSMSALLGARMVSTSETAEGKKLDEITIKRMLSGEKINAQYKYGQPFSFMPTFSPWMSTNNRPIIRATDFGTWRRIVYVPFENTFTDDKKDVNMPKKLAAEAPQILGWMIEGAVRLHTQYNDKLPEPKCLQEELSNYKKTLDVVAAFIDAKCRPLSDATIEEGRLYRVYKNWCLDNGEYCLPESKFKLEIPNKGYKLVKDYNLGYVYCGLSLYEDIKGLKFGD